MVSLRSLVTGAVALMAATVNAAATPQQIADGINQITKKAQDLQAPAQSITILNAPLIVIGQGPFPQIIAGFQDIVSTATVLAGALPDSKPVQRRGGATIATRGPDADAVFRSYTELVRVFQVLLNILIGKAGPLEQTPVVGPPVAAVLRAVEGIIDNISINLINLVESRARDLGNEANSLDATLTLAIDKYQGLGSAA